MIVGRFPFAIAVDRSCLDGRLFNSSSRVSAPVFFDFGELVAELIPSLKDDRVLNLSTYVVYLLGKIDCTDPGSSKLDVAGPVPNDEEADVKSYEDEDSK